MSGTTFNQEQKEYLAGFIAGGAFARGMRGGGPPQTTFADALAAAGTPVATPAAEPPLPSGPERIHYLAQDRFTKAGQKLTNEEQAKRKVFPLDVWDMVRGHAAERKFPKGTDVFLFKFQGLFYVAPAQDSFMCRLRFPGGVVSPAKLRAVADLAERYGGGYADVTTRANLQIREIAPGDTVKVLEGLYDVGIINRGAGADNVRNITGSPTAGIDLHELIDVRPLCRELHHYILNHRELYGLPRKFNIAFDGGGSVSVVEDTNDIGFAAVRVGEGRDVPAGVYFRMGLAGITGHKDFARDAGVVVPPEEAVEVAAAVVRIFIEHGDRTDRRKARLKYVIDRIGVERFLEEVEQVLGRKLARLAAEACEPRTAEARMGHVGVHPQRQEGLCYVGVVPPVGRLTCGQMRGLADIAARGGGTLRLTVWQNLLISDVPEQDVQRVKQEVEGLGLHWSVTAVRSGLVACTGNTGCKFSATDTKRHARQIADYLDGRVELDRPVNIHLTGCPHSCAQHFIGDIGLLGTKVTVGEETVEGYHVFVGGGYGARREIGREVLRDVAAADAPRVVEAMLRTYLEQRERDEGLADFARRHSTERLKELFVQRISHELSGVA
jgi:ferredoxin-nitrite reductase